MKRLLLLICCCFIGGIAFSQGIVRGKITDETGQTVIGATIVLKSNPGIGAVTDFDGNYSLKITESAAQVLVVSFIGYQKIEESVNPLANAVVIRNFSLVPQSQEIIGVEIEENIDEAKKLLIDKGLSKLIVYRDDIDNIIGYIHSFDLFFRQNRRR